MTAAEGSLSYRYTRAALRWMARTGHESLAGRALRRATSSAGRAVGNSRVLGTDRIAAPALDLPSKGSLSSAVLPSSTLAGGDWIRVVGAGLLGSGCSLVSSRTVLGVTLIVVGALLALIGPAVRTGADSSVLRLTPSAWVTTLLSFAAGVLVGAAAAGGTEDAAAFAVVVAVAATLLWRPEAVLLILAAFPWIDWAARHSLGGLGPLWDDALLVVSAALVLWSAFVLKRGTLRRVPITLPVILLFMATVASIVVREVPGNVGIYGLRVLFEPILFYFVGFLLPKDLRWTRWAIAMFVVACTGLALHGLYQYVTHAPMPASWVDVDETGIAVRAYSVILNPNGLGALLAMGGLVSGSLALSRAVKRRGRVLVGAACLVQLAGLAVTFSRGAWLGFVIGLLAMGVLAYRKYLAAFVVAGVVVWFVAPQVFIQRLLFAFSSTYLQRSTVGLGRVFRWDEALHRIVEHPLFGVGLGTFGGTSAALLGYWALWVDNFYLQIAAEGGLLSLAFFLFLLLWTGKGLVRGHRVADDPFLKAATAGVFGAFVALLVSNAFASVWETLAVGVEFWFLAGLVTSAALPLEPTTERATIRSPEIHEARE
jgi:O-antigen ligase